MTRPAGWQALVAATWLLALPGLAAADEPVDSGSLVDAVTAGKPMTSFRLRYEHVDQDGKPEQAEGLTLRSLVGWQTAPWHSLSFALQAINVSAAIDDYDSFDKGVPQLSKVAYPRIVDPHDTDINQAYVDWTGLPGTRLRVGRQSVKLDNVRFVGNVEFRQVMQVFDGVSLENRETLPGTTLFLAHFAGVKQITTAYQSANIEVANLRWNFAPGQNAVAYGYLTDWDDPALRTSLTSPNNRTLGLRLDGAAGAGDVWKALYTAEYAWQSDYRGGNPGVGAHYSRLGLGAQHGESYLRIDQEVLSGDGISAFQTPLATNHLFQGWADLFLVTPAAGIRDTFVSAGTKVAGVQLLAEYHWIDAYRDFATPAGAGTGSRYGTELDLAASYGWGHWLARIEFASFREGDPLGATATTRKRDTDKVWLTTVYSF